MSLRRSVLVYAQFARLAFQRQAAYRLANWTGIAVNFFFFLIHAQVYLGFFGARSEVSGWSPDDAVLYFAISESLLMVLGIFAFQTGTELAERIRTGDVVFDLARPVQLWARALAERFGSAAYYLGTRAVVLYVGAALFYGLSRPLDAELLLLPLSLALGIAIAGLLTYTAAACAFWFEFAHGPIGALVMMLIFFGGVAVPLDFYPDALRAVCNVLPFRGAVYTPVALATGRIQGVGLLFGLLHQTLWLALLVCLARAVEAAGVRRMVTQGG